MKKSEKTTQTLIKVKKNYQVTLPPSMRKEYKIMEGDYIEMTKKGQDTVIRPVKLVHPDQAYFYTKEWQKGEAEADKDIAKGRVVGPFDNIKDAMKELNS